MILWAEQQDGNLPDFHCFGNSWSLGFSKLASHGPEWGGFTSFVRHFLKGGSGIVFQLPLPPKE